MKLERNVLLDQAPDSVTNHMVYLPGGLVVHTLPPRLHRDGALGGYELAVTDSACVVSASIRVNATELGDCCVLLGHGYHDKKSVWRFGDGQAVVPTVLAYNAYAKDHGLSPIQVVAVCNKSNSNSSEGCEELFKEGIVFPQSEAIHIHVNEQPSGSLRILCSAKDDESFANLKKPSLDNFFLSAFEDPRIYQTTGTDGVDGACFESVERLLTEFAKRQGDISNLHVAILSYRRPGGHGFPFIVNNSILRPEEQSSPTEGWDYHTIIINDSFQTYDLLCAKGVSNYTTQTANLVGISFSEYLSLLHPYPIGPGANASNLLVTIYHAADVVYPPAISPEGATYTIDEFLRLQR